MIRKAIDRALLGEWLDALVEGGRRVLAPVREGGALAFRPVGRGYRPDLDAGRSDFSLKEWVFPPSESVLQYCFQPEGVRLQEPEPEMEETVALFARPCDAAALEALDAVFAGDQPDPFYVSRRQQLTVVGLACTEAQPECFCPAVGLSPAARKGSDVLLTPLGERLLVEILTEKGERLVAESASLFAGADGLSAETAVRAAEGRISRREPLQSAAGTLEEQFESDVWEALARTCLGCGVCAFVCPTCHCFDIVDEGDAAGGCRLKNWDGCCFGHFTLHASGHNPRPTQAHRYRQRVMHKFCYFLQTFGQNMCVGCGRCVAHCPVQLDIYQVGRTLVGGRPA